MICDLCNNELDELSNFRDDGYSKRWCEDCYAMLEASEQAISVARQIDVPKYGPSSWRDVSVEEHLEHAVTHLQNLIQEVHVFVQVPDYPGLRIPKTIYKIAPIDGEDHLSHAICRLAMVKALQGESNVSKASD